MRFGLLVALLLGGVCMAEAQEACSSSEFEEACERGRDDAQSDLRSGDTRLFVWGLVDDAVWPIQARLLRERFGLAPLWMGCVIGDSLWAQTEAYNEEVERALEERFGENALRQAWDDAAARVAGRKPLNPDVIRDIEPPRGVSSGLVFVSFFVAPTGEPVELSVERSPDTALDAAALEAAAQLRFAPARDVENGERWGRYFVPVRFRISAED